jgi:uncharacterized membrane protein (UPF0127 family)
MNIKNKQNILLGIIVVCFVILFILIFNQYTLSEINQNQEEGFAAVTFLLSNNSTVEFLCEIASTPQERSQGLMNRTELPPEEGMLFIFDTPQYVSFWMKNTLIPLDIIFINETGFVINIESGKVEVGISDNNLTRYHSLRPAQFVIEINTDLCSLYGIREGTQVIIEYV